MRSEHWIDLGYRRIQNILRMMKIATMRTLEQKISDAGPFNQRVEPHNLTKARNKLEQEDIVITENRQTGKWYRLSTTPRREWQARLELVEPIVQQMQDGTNHIAVGQTLEMAVYRALCMGRSNHEFVFLGGFPGQDKSDSRNLKKIDPPSLISGRYLAGGKKLDFVLVHARANLAGVEVKNTREWIYPDSKEIRELLSKCYELDAVPVMVCRRYAYVTFSVLNRCGVLLHQNYKQLLPDHLHDLAERAKNKELLGYHDIHLGNEPDQRLRHFIGELPHLLTEAKNRFVKYKDLLWEFARENMRYSEFAARCRRRSQGVSEDSDQPEDLDEPEDLY